MKMSCTFELDVAKWLCQNRVSFSSNCRLVLTIRVYHQRLISPLLILSRVPKSKLDASKLSIAELSIWEKLIR